MSRRVALGLVITVALTAAAQAQQPAGPEYRLKVADGVPFAFDHAEEQYFSALPFISAGDFAAVEAQPSKNPNTPGGWEVVLTHTALGRAKFRAVVDADRSREFCLIFQRTLYQCQAFPPVQKVVYDKGLAFGGSFSRDKARTIAAAMRAQIRRARR